MLSRPAAAAIAPGDLLPPDIRQLGEITIATDAHYPPCESLAEDGTTIEGFEPDLWNAIGAKLGLHVHVVAAEFSGLIPGVQSGRYTMALECISDSAEREKQVTFIDYAFATSAVYTLATNTTVSSDAFSLCGLSTAAQAGTDSVESLGTISTHCVKAGLPALTIAQFPSAEAMFAALISGRVDFVLNDAVAEEPMRKQMQVALRSVSNPLLPRLYTGIIVLADQQQLAQALLAAIKALQADGTYAGIMQKWKLASLSLPNPGINLATAQPLPIPLP